MDNRLQEIYLKNLKLWILQHWRISSGEFAGDPYSFAGLHFLQGYIEDQHRHKIFMKCAQCGVSEITLAEMFAYADISRGNHLLVWPAKEQLRDFIKARIHKSIENNPYLSERTGKSYSLRMIPFGLNNIYMRGAESPRDVESVDANFLYLDERDLFDERTVSILYNRIQGKENTLVREFSTPRLPKSGIDAQYSGGSEIGLTDGTDERQWHVQCPSCGYLQWVEWADEEENLVNFRNLGSEESPQVICFCTKCDRQLDPSGPGRWVAQRPSKTGDVHGYHIAAWNWPIRFLNLWYKKWANPRTRPEFMKYQAGLPYLPPGAQITKEMIRKIRGNHANGAWDKFDGITRPKIMGIDQGTPHYYWVGYPDSTVVEKGTKRKFEDLHRLMDQHQIHRCVIDIQPETELVAQMKRKYPGRVYSCQFAKKYKENVIEDQEIIFEDNHVWANRHMAMIRVQEDVKSGVFTLPVDIMDDKSFLSHMRVNAKVLIEDENGNLSYEFPETRRADHHFFAGVYFCLARELYSSTIIRVANVDPMHPNQGPQGPYQNQIEQHRAENRDFIRRAGDPPGGRGA